MAEVRTQLLTGLPDAILVTLLGKLDVQQFQEFDATLQSWEKRGILYFVFDLTKIPFITSLTIALLYNLGIAARGRGGRVILVGASRDIESSLEALGFLGNTLFVCGTIEEAIASCRQAGRTPAAVSKEAVSAGKRVHQGFRVTIEKFPSHPTAAIVQITGKLEEETRERLLDQWLGLLNENVFEIGLDLSGLDRITSLGVVLLITLQNSLSRQSGKLILFGLAPSARTILETTSPEIFQFRESRQEVLVALGAS